jgi:hypothetical protein
LKRTLTFLFLCLLVALPGAASAQFSAPLIITLNGDFWAWYGDASTPPVSVTQWGYNEPGVLSPDGSRVAYNSLAQIVVDAFARVGPVGGGALPSNIWIADPISGQGVRVGEQPPQASFMVEGVPDFGIARSDPAWSPNGAQLAWAEQTYPTPSDAIIVYDLASQSAFAVASGLTPSAGVPAPKEVLWGQTGIVVRDLQPGADGAIVDAFSVYAPTGGIISQFTVGGSGRALVYDALMQVNGREALGVLMSDGVWELIDLASGAAQTAAGIPELYSLRAPDSSLSLRPTLNEQGGFTWQVLTPGGEVVAAFPSASFFVPQRYALSPDGQAVAYSDYLDAQRVFADTINVWQNGAITVMPNALDFPLIGAVAWSPMGWRVRAGVG